MAEQPLHTIQFRLTRTDRVAPLLDEVIKTVAPLLNIPVARQEEVIFKSKVVISELLTNTIKHTHQKTTLLEAIIYSNKLCFIRRDYCAPLHFPASQHREALSWPLPQNRTGEKIVVYEDDLNALWITVTPTGAEFSVTPKPTEDCNINSLHEHFGLLLITLSSDRFHYEYNPNTAENLFDVCISL